VSSASAELREGPSTYHARRSLHLPADLQPPQQQEHGWSRTKISRTTSVSCCWRWTRSSRSTSRYESPADRRSRRKQLFRSACVPKRAPSGWTWLANLPAWAVATQRGHGWTWWWAAVAATWPADLAVCASVDGVGGRQPAARRQSRLQRRAGAAVARMAAAGGCSGRRSYGV